MQCAELHPTLNRVLRTRNAGALTLSSAYVFLLLRMLSALNLGVVSVLASLGPVVTGALARAVSGERLSRSQRVGSGLTLLGTLLAVYRP